jgi:hypothetical protein
MIFFEIITSDIKVAHPQMLEAITVAKKKNDISDAEKIADLLRLACRKSPKIVIGNIVILY